MVVERLPRCVKVVARSRTSPVQLMLPVFTGDRILVTLVLDAFTFTPDPGSLLLQHLEHLTHTGDLLAQQNEAKYYLNVSLNTRKFLLVFGVIKRSFCVPKK